MKTHGLRDFDCRPICGAEPTATGATITAGSIVAGGPVPTCARCRKLLRSEAEQMQRRAAALLRRLEETGRG